jgi:hypothetical protein
LGAAAEVNGWVVDDGELSIFGLGDWAIGGAGADTGVAAQDGRHYGYDAGH